MIIDRCRPLNFGEADTIRIVMNVREAYTLARTGALFRGEIEALRRALGADAPAPALVGRDQAESRQHEPRRSIVQDWVQQLGLRHQGVLMSAVRGCDTAPKNSGSKSLTRYLRAAVLNAHCGDPTKAKSFIEVPTYEAFKSAEEWFFVEWDALPLHYVMHFAHAAAIIGYAFVGRDHPAGVFRTPLTGGGTFAVNVWLELYWRICKKLHLNPETEEQLDTRLNADEDTFGVQQKE